MNLYQTFAREYIELVIDSPIEWSVVVRFEPKVPASYQSCGFLIDEEEQLLHLDGRVARVLGAPWKGASSQWVRIPRSNCRFRLVAARAIYGGRFTLPCFVIPAKAGSTASIPRPHSSPGWWSRSMYRARFVHSQGRIRDRSHDAQQKRVVALNLVIAAIVYWNTWYMNKAATHLRRQGPWTAEAFASQALHCLLRAYGVYARDRHRVLAVCEAGVWLLAQRLSVSGDSVLAAMRRRALTPTVRLWAIRSPFSSKEALRARGYRWIPDDHPVRPAVASFASSQLTTRSTSAASIADFGATRCNVRRRRPPPVSRSCSSVNPFSVSHCLSSSMLLERKRLTAPARNA